jgi:DNA primase
VVFTLPAEVVSKIKYPKIKNMKNELNRPSEIYRHTLELLESDVLPLNAQKLLLESLQCTSELKRIIDGLSREDRQYDYENYLVELSLGTLQFDLLALSFVNYQFKQHGIDTRLLELYTNITASKMEEYNECIVSEKDKRFFEREIKKVINNHPYNE